MGKDVRGKFGCGADAAMRWKGLTMGAQGDQAKGHAKEVVGKLTGNEDLESEGKADRRAGEAKEKVGDVKDKVEEVVDKAEDKVEEVIDKAKDTLHRK